MSQCYFFVLGIRDEGNNTAVASYITSVLCHKDTVVFIVLNCIIFYTYTTCVPELKFEVYMCTVKAFAFVDSASDLSSCVYPPLVTCLTS